MAVASVQPVANPGAAAVVARAVPAAAAALSASSFERGPPSCLTWCF